MRLDGLKGQPSTGSQGIRRAAEGVESERRMKRKRGDQETEDPPEVRLSENNKAPARTIGKKGIRGADRDGKLKVEKGPKRAKERIRDREECYKSRLIVTLKSFGPANMNSKRRRRVRNIPSPKVTEGIERRRGRRSQV
jgi:hypothetical protein